MSSNSNFFQENKIKDHFNGLKQGIQYYEKIIDDFDSGRRQKQIRETDGYKPPEYYLHPEYLTAKYALSALEQRLEILTKIDRQETITTKELDFLVKQPQLKEYENYPNIQVSDSNSLTK